MDQIVLLTLSLCWWTTTARYVWSDKPGILVDYEISEGETAQIICLLPIDYSGGLCRLFRGDARTPFKVMTATTYSCYFNLTSKEVLGESMVGSTIMLRCDYRLQDYTSVSSDTKPVTVWGTRPSPHLSINRRLFSTEDIIEVTCAGGERESPSSCLFYNSIPIIAEGPCSRNITIKNLIEDIKPSVLHLVNLTCTYDPDEFLAIRSEHSNQQLLIVVDTSLVTGTSSVDCLVSMSDDQLEAFRERTWRSSGANGTTITVQMTNSSLNIQTTCTESLNKTKVI